jgi:hypothetical protein
MRHFGWRGKVARRSHRGLRIAASLWKLEQFRVGMTHYLFLILRSGVFAASRRMGFSFPDGSRRRKSASSP